MIIKNPASGQIPALRRLWQQAFGDSDAFLNAFFDSGFSTERCRCVLMGETLCAALYWFDAQWEGKKLAYLYAVATDREFQGRGFCRALIEDTHRHLLRQGYGGTVLVPGSQGLFGLYEKLGYQCFGGIREFSCSAAQPKAQLRRIDGQEYASLRKKFLPDGGVLQEGPVLAFLQTQACFYAGQDTLLCAAVEGSTLIGAELLGNGDAAPGILAALGAEQGRFRTPGQKPFAMFHPLGDTPAPAYFGLALD